MKTIKKIDDYRRIRIPSDFQNYLGWNKGDEIEIEIVNNEIILRKYKNTPELNVVTSDSIEKPSLVRTEEFSIPSEPVYYKLNSKSELIDDKSNNEINKLSNIKNEENETILKKPDKINKIPTINEYFNIKPNKENTKISLDILDKKDELNDRLCPKCRKPIESSRFKYDHKYICRNCRNKLRDKLYSEIKNKEVI